MVWRMERGVSAYTVGNLCMVKNHFNLVTLNCTEDIKLVSSQICRPLQNGYCSYALHFVINFSNTYPSALHRILDSPTPFDSFGLTISIKHARGMDQQVDERCWSH